MDHHLFNGLLLNFKCTPDDDKSRGGGEVVLDYCTSLDNCRITSTVVLHTGTRHIRIARPVPMRYIFFFDSIWAFQPIVGVLRQ